MKGLIGIALALTVALIGCERQTTQQGGGGGMEKKTTTTATTGPTLVERAAKNASDAQSLLAHKDFKGAAREVQQTRELINRIQVKAPAEMKGQVAALDKAAIKAEASINTHSANATKDTEALVKGLNDMVATESKIMGGGGKPIQ